MTVAQMLAEFVLYVHFVYVLAVVLPVPLIPLGWHLGWRWVLSRKLRAVHASLMGFVLIEVIVGVVCPLTWLEQQLLEAAGQRGYEGSFIAYWVSQIMYWQAPPWMFVAAYCAFFALIAVLWKLYPPGITRPR